MENRRAKVYGTEDDFKTSEGPYLSGDDLIDFKRYLKIKTALITWNLIAASVSFFVFFV